MIAADLQRDAYDVISSTDDGLVLRKLTNAVSALSLKGNWDPLLGYLTLPVAASGDIVLPSDVDVPLRVNVNDRPASFQDQYFEFDVNRPGETGAQLGWTFGVKLTTPLQVALATPTRLKVSAASPNVRVTGIDEDTGQRMESVTLQTTYSGPTWREIISVSKDVGSVNSYVDVLTEQAQGSLAADGRVARYHWRDTNPEFRVIRLDGADARPSSIRLLYRRRSYDLRTWQDYIPLASKLAVTFMLRSLYAFERGELQAGEGYQTKALEFLADEQKARQAAGEAAAAEGQKTSVGNYNHRFGGLVTYGEVYDDAAAIFGALGRERLFDRMTGAVEQLARKATWDSLVGYADVTVTPDPAQQSVVVALPSWCDSVLSVLREGRPTAPRSRWIDFHLNGPYLQDSVPIDHFDYMEDGPLVSALPAAGAQIVAVRESTADAALSIRVEGLDTDGRQVTEEYLLLPDPATIPGPYGSTTWARIDRISKPLTTGYARVHVRGTSPVIGAQLSEGRPGEREFRFRRIRVQCQTTRVTVAYRKRVNRCTALDDVIHLRSRDAIVEMMRAMKIGDPQSGEGYNPQMADYHELKAIRLLSEEQKANKPAQTVRIQCDDELLHLHQMV